MQTFPRGQHLLNRAIQVTVFLGYGQYKHGISFILHATLAEDFDPSKEVSNRKP